MMFGKRLQEYILKNKGRLVFSKEDVKRLKNPSFIAQRELKSQNSKKKKDPSHSKRELYRNTKSAQLIRKPMLFENLALLPSNIPNDFFAIRV